MSSNASEEHLGRSEEVAAGWSRGADGTWHPPDDGKEYGLTMRVPPQIAESSVWGPVRARMRQYSGLGLPVNDRLGFTASVVLVAGLTATWDSDVTVLVRVAVTALLVVAGVVFTRVRRRRRERRSTPTG